MSCSGCTKKYGLFLRESGCPNCGFSFCSKCLKYTIADHKRKVCSGCFNKASLPAAKPLHDFPKTSPQATPTTPPSVTQSEPVPESQDANPNDEQLLKRLENLKKKDESTSKIEPITDLNLKQRLAKLQDQRFVEEKRNRDIFHVDKKTDQEKVNDLVERYYSEAAIDTASDPVKDLEERLNKLRGQPADGGPGTSHKTTENTVPSGDGDSDDDDKRYVKKILAEAMLDAQLNYTDEEKELLEGIPKPPKNPEDLEELPWCTICNEDAKQRCLDCDGELYCNACFKEIHDDEEYRRHRSKKYQKPKTADDSDHDSD